MNEPVTLVLKNELQELERFAPVVEQLTFKHSLGVEERYALFLCLEEIGTNIIRYAWPQGGRHQFEVKIHVDAECIRLDFADDGIAFDPCQSPDPDLNKPVAERPVGGLGIHLVRESTDQMAYQRMDDRNYLFLKRARGRRK